MKLHRIFLFACLAAPIAALGGGTVADRTTLTGILSGSGYTETFEGYSITSGAATTFTGQPGLLDYTSIISSSYGTGGPNLVVPGVTFTGTNLQWDAGNYYSAPSKEILFNSPSITIDFTTSTNAFGLDVRDFSGYSAIMSVIVYAANDTTVLATFSGGSAITLTGTPVFFGYQDTGGIGKVILTNAASSWSPIIDNLAFTAVPEPSTLMLMGFGIAAVAFSRLRSRAVHRRG